MPSQHKHYPVAYRPPGELRAWLLAYAKQTGRAVNAIITQALSELRDREQANSTDQQDDC